MTFETWFQSIHTDIPEFNYWQHRKCIADYNNFLYTYC